MDGAVWRDLLFEWRRVCCVSGVGLLFDFQPCRTVFVDASRNPRPVSSIDDVAVGDGRRRSCGLDFDPSLGLAAVT